MSNEIYHNNLAALKDRFPEVYRQLLSRSGDLPFTAEYFNTECGQANVLVTLPDGRRISFYDKDDITGSTEELMADWQLETQDILFCMGMGLGYYPLTASQKISTRPSIVIIEPCTAVFNLALKSLDLSLLFNYQRLEIFIGNELNAAEIIAKKKFHIFLGKQRVVTHVASRVIFGERFAVIERVLKENISLAKDLWHTDTQLGREMFSNVMSNLTSLFDGVSLGNCWASRVTKTTCRLSYCRYFFTAEFTSLRVTFSIARRKRSRWLPRMP